MSHFRLPLSRPRIRTVTFAWTLSLVLACVLGMAPGEVRAEGPGRPVGHVTLEAGQGGFILSATGGKGTLTFKGRTYAFKVGGLGVGELGVSKIRAVGEVYRLRRVEDFPGGYFQARAGYAAGSGRGVQWLENANGVVLKLRSTTKGLSLNLGADGLRIEMGHIQKSRPRG